MAKDAVTFSFHFFTLLRIKFYLVWLIGVGHHTIVVVVVDCIFGVSVTRIPWRNDKTPNNNGILIGEKWNDNDSSDK